MKKSYIFKSFLIFLFIISQAGYGQNTDYQWTFTGGSLISEYAYGVETDVNGNVYTTGTFQGGVDFDPSSNTLQLSTNGKQDVFVQKLNSNGDLVWALSFGSSDYDDQGHSIKVDDLGNVYVAGVFRGSVDFDPSSNTQIITANDYYKNFVVKYDSNGQFLWVKDYGRTSYSEDRMSLALDQNGNVYTTGYFRDTADFDPSSNTFNVTSNMFSDIFVHKMNSSGGFEWVKTMGAGSHDVTHGIEVSDSGFIYVIGELLDTVDFDPSSAVYNQASNGIRDYFLLKLDINGNFVWVRSAGGPSNEIPYDLAIDSDENIYIGGYMEDSGDLDPSSNVNNINVVGAFTAFVLKIDKNGDFKWAYNLDGTDVRSIAYGIDVDENNNVYLTGYYEQTIDFDFSNSSQENYTSNGQSDVFVLKMDTNAGFLWNNTLGSTGNDRAYAISVKEENDLKVAGIFFWTVDFDFTGNSDNIESNGSADIFVTNWYPETLSLNDSENLKSQTLLFPNPANDFISLEIKNSSITSFDVEIYTIEGKSIFIKKEITQKENIVLPKLNTGVYFVKLKSEKGIVIKKLLIK